MTTKKQISIESNFDNSNKLLEMKLERTEDKNSLSLFIKTHKRFENFMKELGNGQTGESEQWKDTEGEYHEYYYRDYNNCQDLKNLFTGYNNSFGDRFYEQRTDTVNLAVLRTVNLSEGVEFQLPNRMSPETAKKQVKEIRDVVAKIYKLFLKEYEIKATLSRAEVL